MENLGYKTIGCLSAMAAFDAMIAIMMGEVDGFKLASLVRDKTMPILRP